MCLHRKLEAWPALFSESCCVKDSWVSNDIGSVGCTLLAEDRHATNARAPNAGVPLNERYIKLFFILKVCCASRVSKTVRRTWLLSSAALCAFYCIASIHSRHPWSVQSCLINFLAVPHVGQHKSAQ